LSDILSPPSSIHWPHSVAPAALHRACTGINLGWDVRPSSSPLYSLDASRAVERYQRTEPPHSPLSLGKNHCSSLIYLAQVLIAAKPKALFSAQDHVSHFPMNCPVATSPSCRSQEFQTSFTHHISRSSRWPSPRRSTRSDSSAADRSITCSLISAYARFGQTTRAMCLMRWEEARTLPLATRYMMHSASSGTWPQPRASSPRCQPRSPLSSCSICQGARP
jgi:hypothetical protein